MARKLPVKKKASVKVESSGNSNKLIRVDAQRNLDAILKAAMDVFEKSGVDAPVREITENAGVGIGTFYRHFPQRSDLIKALVQQGVDTCALAAEKLASSHEPFEALALWMQRLIDFLKTKKGLASALHSGDPAYKNLPDYFRSQLTAALEGLLEAARRNGDIKVKVDAGELLFAAARVATPASEGDIPQARRMVALLVDGLRYRGDGN